MRTYRFECHDEDTDTSTTVTFTTENDAWSEYDGPMWKFFDFLKGCGYVFDIESEIGVIDRNGSFRSACGQFSQYD